MVHLSHSKKMRFMPTAEGLYHYTAEYATSLEWTLVQTVQSKMEGCTNSKLAVAASARKPQNTMMHPMTVDMMAKAKKQLANCPIMRADASAAKDTCGPNIGMLKGQSVRRGMPSPSPLLQMDQVPAHIMEMHKHVVLSADIFFMNKLAFLTTMSQKMRFVAVEHLVNRQALHVAKKIEAVLKLHQH